jgi:hypothetical protein
LKTQIDGFTAVSSGVTALQGTVTSLQAAVAALPKSATPATDITGLQTALTSLAATVAELKTSLGTAATAADVAALAASLTKVQTDLSDLLASNNFYTPTGAFEIKTVAQLTFAENLGSKIGIINGSVEVTQISAMDAARLAAVLAKITSITGSLTYNATGTSVVPTAGFTTLSGVLDLTVDTDGAISFPKLASAAKIWLKNNAKSTSVSFPALATLTDLGGAAAGDNTLSLTAATSFNMGLLTRYAATALSITIKSGLVNLDALQIFAENAITKQVTKLTINGATEISVDALTEGEIDADSVLVVDFPVWKGNTGSIFNTATTVVLPKIEATASANTYNVQTMFPIASSVHIIGAAKALSTVATGTISVNVTSQTSIKTLILDGALDVVSVTGTSALNSVTHTGTAKDVTYTGTAVVDMVLAYTSATTGATNAAALNGGLNVSLNLSLVSLTANSVDDITDLTIKNNVKLTTLSFTALNSVGTATAAYVDIQTNKLAIEKIQLASEANALPVVAKTINSVALGPLKAYVVAAKAKIGTAGYVIIKADSVASKLKADGTTDTVATADQTISNFEVAANRTSNSVGGTAQVKEFYVTNNSSNTYSISVNGYASSIANSASDLSFDLAEWAATASVVSGLDAAGVTVTTGAGPFAGKIALTAISASTLLTQTFSVSVNSKTYSVTISGPLANDDTDRAKVINGLALQIAANVDVTNAKFTVSSGTPNELNVATVARGSASAAFGIGKIASFVGTNTAGTPTVITSTANPMLRPSTSGYIRVTNKTAGLVAAANADASILGGSVSATILAVDGTVASPASGDNENVVAAKDGTAQSNQPAIDAASVYEVAFLAS